MFKSSTTLLFAFTIAPPHLFWLLGVILAFLAGVIILFACLKRWFTQWLDHQMKRHRRR